MLAVSMLLHIIDDCRALFGMIVKSSGLAILQEGHRLFCSEVFP